MKSWCAIRIVNEVLVTQLNYSILMAMGVSTFHGFRFQDRDRNVLEGQWYLWKIWITKYYRNGDLKLRQWKLLLGLRIYFLESFFIQILNFSRVYTALGVLSFYTVQILLNFFLQQKLWLAYELFFLSMSRNDLQNILNGRNRKLSEQRRFFMPTFYIIIKFS